MGDVCYLSRKVEVIVIGHDKSLFVLSFLANISISTFLGVRLFISTLLALPG